MAASAGRSQAFGGQGRPSFAGLPADPGPAFGSIADRCFGLPGRPAVVEAENVVGDMRPLVTGQGPPLRPVTGVTSARPGIDERY
jgi:hypothetical protein